MTRATRPDLLKRKDYAPCKCARCRGVPNADPKFGYDPADIPKTKCRVCKKPIGQEPYSMDTGLARFGNIFLTHKRCEGATRG